MTNIADSRTTSSEVETQETIMEKTPVPAVKSHKKMWIIIVSVLVVLCLLCSGILIVSFATGIGTVILERKPVEQVLNQFMSDMVHKETQDAYALFSDRGQRTMSELDLKKWVTGNYYVLFDGYQKLTVQNIKVTAAVNTDPDAPQGKVITADGFITYDKGFYGEFHAVLEKVDGLWKIYSINLTVPPDKLQ